MDSPVEVLSLLVAERPYELYARLRAQRPVCPARYFDGSDVWLVSRHEDVTAVLTDPRFSHDLTAHHRAGADTTSGLPADIAEYFSRSMLDRDPPDHTRLRTLVSRGFTARRVQRLTPRIQQLTDNLLDELGSGSEADLIADYAEPLPTAVISELLGVPPEDHTRWRSWTADLFGIAPDRLADSARHLLDYVFTLVQRRRAEPADDLISDLVHVHRDTDRLSEPELASMVIGLLAAGHETTVQLIGNGMLVLLSHPDQIDRLRAEPALVPRAVEEILRYLGPAEIAGVRRVATEDVRIGDITVHTGQLVLPMLGAANHDPERFTDPERFDITRDARQHLGFGHGIHFCLGAALARAEATIAITGLIHRFPRLRLAVPPEKLTWRHSGVRGLTELPVQLR